MVYFFHMTLAHIHSCIAISINVLPARLYDSAGISHHRVSCPSVCLSHAGIVTKWLNLGSRKQRHVIAQEL